MRGKDPRPPKKSPQTPSTDLAQLPPELSQRCLVLGGLGGLLLLFLLLLGAPVLWGPLHPWEDTPIFGGIPQFSGESFLCGEPTLSSGEPPVLEETPPHPPRGVPHSQGNPPHSLGSSPRCSQPHLALEVLLSLQSIRQVQGQV